MNIPYSHLFRHSAALLCLALAMVSTSCDDFLDVRPKAEKLERDLFATAQGYEDAIYGVYGELYNISLYGMNLTWGINELLAQNLYCRSTAAEALSKYDFTENSDVRSMYASTWSKAYETIGHANNVLNNLQGQSPQTLPLYNYYKGEMLAVRALLHFELVRMFCPTDTAASGIPYVRDYAPKVTPFGTVGATYRSIIADLNEAAALLEPQRAIVTYPRQNKNYDRFLNYAETHLNIYAVEGILARVYWMLGDNTNAARYAQSVIAGGAFPLVAEYEVRDHLAGILSPKETLFGLYSKDYAATAKSYLYEYRSFHSYNPYYNAATAGSGYLEPYTAVFAKNIEGIEQDRRLEHFVQNNSYATLLKNVDYYTIEGNPRAGDADLIKGISVLHVAELYLIAADALLDTDPDRALTLFDAAIQSRGLMSYRQQGKTLTHDIIFDEYRKETFGQGQTWYAMKRQSRDVTSNFENRIVPGSNAIYVVPIPTDENEYRN